MELNDNTTFQQAFNNNTNTKITSTEPASVYRVSSNSYATLAEIITIIFRAGEEKEKTLERDICV
jgi:hypothetical protein